MSRAAERLRVVDAKYGIDKGLGAGAVAMQMDIVRAWIAFAQEVTSHQAASRRGAAGREAG